MNGSGVAGRCLADKGDRCSVSVFFLMRSETDSVESVQDAFPARHSIFFLPRPAQCRASPPEPEGARLSRQWLIQRIAIHRMWDRFFSLKVSSSSLATSFDRRETVFLARHAAPCSTTDRSSQGVRVYGERIGCCACCLPGWVGSWTDVSWLPGLDAGSTHFTVGNCLDVNCNWPAHFLFGGHRNLVRCSSRNRCTKELSSKISSDINHFCWTFSGFCCDANSRSRQSTQNPGSGGVACVGNQRDTLAAQPNVLENSFAQGM